MSYICYIISVSDLVRINFVIKYIIYNLRFVIYINLYTEINSLIIDYIRLSCTCPNIIYITYLQ